jgi:hypothetical protein
VTDPGAISIYYTTDQGQQVATPTYASEWISPPLTRDTVFTVQANATLFNGDPVSASLAVPVSVVQQDLSAMSLAVSGASTLAAVNITGNMQMLGNPIQIPFESSATGLGGDGLIIGTIWADSNNESTFGWISGQCANVTVTAAAGYVYTDGLTKSPLSSSFVLPAPKGQGFAFGGEPNGLSYSLWLVQLGGAGTSTTAPPEASRDPGEPSVGSAISSPMRSELKALLEMLLIDDAAERKRRIRAMLDAVSDPASSESGSA